MVSICGGAVMFILYPYGLTSEAWLSSAPTGLSGERGQ